jgi:hypothetical protein
VVGASNRRLRHRIALRLVACEIALCEVDIDAAAITCGGGDESRRACIEWYLDDRYAWACIDVLDEHL